MTKILQEQLQPYYEAWIRNSTAKIDVAGIQEAFFSGAHAGITYGAEALTETTEALTETTEVLNRATQKLMDKEKELKRFVMAFTFASDRAERLHRALEMIQINAVGLLAGHKARTIAREALSKAITLPVELLVPSPPVSADAVPAETLDPDVRGAELQTPDDVSDLSPLPGSLSPSGDPGSPRPESLSP